MNTISLNLSTTAIMQEIYAASALRCVLNNSSNRNSPLLTRDRSDALRIVVKDAFAHVITRIIAHVESSNLNGETATDATDNQPKDDTEIVLQVNIRTPENFSDGQAGTLRHYMEHAIAMYAMHLCYMGHDETLSRHHERLASDSISFIIKMLRSIPIPSRGTRPHWL